LGELDVAPEIRQGVTLVGDIQQHYSPLRQPGERRHPGVVCFLGPEAGDRLVPRNIIMAQNEMLRG